eukprot:1796771-Rhodomonas_salina.1
MHTAPHGEDLNVSCESCFLSWGLTLRPCPCSLDLLNEQLGFGPSASGTLRFLYTKLCTARRTPYSAGSVLRVTKLAEEWQHLGGKRGYGKYVMTFIIGVATGLVSILAGSAATYGKIAATFGGCCRWFVLAMLTCVGTQAERSAGRVDIVVAVL